MNRFLDNCKKRQKTGKNADFMLFLTFFLIFGPFLLILNKKKKSKFQTIFFENLKNFKNWAKKC